MNSSETRTRAAILLALPVAGMIALYLSEVVMLLAEARYEADRLTPLTMIVIALCVSSVPILLLTFFNGAYARWGALGVASLLTLFHALHIAEHFGADDTLMASLIIFTMFLPSLFGSILIWRAKAET